MPLRACTSLLPDNKPLARRPPRPLAAACKDVVSVYEKGHEIADHTVSHVTVRKAYLLW